ncbi:MAG: tetratricopeptide repeat protein [Deltaproteobacteria bacterium]|nr:tetratricopeptide repeat protein [Deltaproteobacteria bacterium]
MFKNKWIKLILVFFMISIFIAGCKSIGANLANGWKYFDKKEYALSARYYENILNEEPDHQVSLLMAGWCYFKLERYEEALMSFERLKELDKKSFDALEGIGWSTFKLHDFKKSLETFETMHEKKKNHIGAIEGIAYNYFKLGKLEQAKKYLKTAFKKDPESADNHVIRGYIAFMEKDYPLAIKYFNKSLELSEKPDPDTLTAIGNVYLAQKDYNNADLWFNKGLEQNAKHPGATAGRASLAYIKRTAMARASEFYTQKQYSRALNAFRKVEQKYPLWAEVHTAIGWTQYKKLNYREAQKSFEAGLKLNKLSYDGYDGLGWSMLKLGKDSEAKEAFKKALDLYPDYISSTAGLEELKNSAYQQ